MENAISRNRGARRMSWALGLTTIIASGYAPYSVAADKANADTIFEYDITGDIAIASGEPQIAVDPANPKNIAIIEFARGSKEFPVNVSRTAEERARTADDPRAGSDGDVSLSTDGGTTWTKLPRASVMNRPPITGGDPPRRGGGDPYIGYGPKGALYIGHEPSAVRQRTGSPFNLPDSDVVVAYSGDGGKTFGVPQIATTPGDRPWLTVDTITGMVYTVSSGAMNFKDHTHNLDGPDAVTDRWLVAWKPKLAGKSEPHRIGGPDFAGTNGNGIAAAHGILAATFSLGMAFQVRAADGDYGQAGNSLPASLRPLVPSGVTGCTSQKPCLFFETSIDNGAQWTRHYVPLSDGFAARQANVSADPGKKGRFAVSVLNSAQNAILVMITDDSGKTWSGPHIVPETVSGGDFKKWTAYGPTGVLGIVWKKERADLTPPAAPTPAGAAQNTPVVRDEPAYDVYATVSCDGGKTWEAPVRVNGAPSPPGNGGTDDLSYIALDNKYAHMVWGDRRLQPADKAQQIGSVGRHSFYGRVPFSVVTKGKRCGR